MSFSYCCGYDGNVPSIGLCGSLRSRLIMGRGMRSNAFLSVAWSLSCYSG